MEEKIKLHKFISSAIRKYLNENIKNKRTNLDIWYHGSNSPKLSININNVPWELFLECVNQV